MKKLSQLEASLLFTIEQGDPVDAEQAKRLAKRGLATTKGNSVFVSNEGRAAFRRFMGADLVKAPRRVL